MNIIKHFLYTISLVVGLSPLLSHADTITGSSPVYMDYPNGADELLVMNYETDIHFAWDIFQSATPEEATSWTLDRTYLAEDYSEDIINSDYWYAPVAEPALRYDGAWYFVVEQTENYEGLGYITGAEVWRVAKRGTKPQPVLSVDTALSSHSDTSALTVWNEQLTYVATDGRVFTSQNGRNWAEQETLDIITNQSRRDVLANKHQAYVATDSTVFRSNDFSSWVDLGNPCTSTPEMAEFSCSITHIGLRPNKGLYALTYSFADDFDIIYQLWVYRRGNWSLANTYQNYLQKFYKDGDRVFLGRSRSSANYFHSIDEVMGDGSLVARTNRRSDTFIGFLNSGLYMTAPNDSSDLFIKQY